MGERRCNYLLYVKESHLAYPGFEVEGAEMAELRKHNAIKQRLSAGVNRLLVPLYQNSWCRSVNTSARQTLMYFHINFSSSLALFCNSQSDRNTQRGRKWAWAVRQLPLSFLNCCVWAQGILLGRNKGQKHIPGSHCAVTGSHLGRKVPVLLHISFICAKPTITVGTAKQRLVFSAFFPQFSRADRF